MLQGKLAVVTGGSRGIGRAVAKQLAAEGAAVIVNYQGSREKALAVVEEIRADGGQAEAMACNVSDYASCETMFQNVIRNYGRLDILVNNAGITRDNLMMKLSTEEFDAVLDTNLKGCFYCMKLVTRQMLKQRSGRIINLSSVVGLHGNAGQVNYAASKAGVIGMTKSAAKELASRGITVNAVAPGFIETDMTAILPEAVRQQILTQIPLGKMGDVTDVANMICFLASDRAGYVTGQVISVDGGMSI